MNIVKNYYELCKPNVVLMNINTTQTFELSNEELIEKAVNNNEAVLADNGALTAVTGERTGRSPNDRFIVKEPGTEDLIEWGDVNKPFDSDKFDALWNKVETYLAEKDRYLTGVHVGISKSTAASIISFTLPRTSSDSDILASSINSS